VDLERFSKVVQSLYATSLGAKSWDNLAAEITGLFGAQGCGLQIQDPATGMVRWLGNTGNMASQIQRSYEEHYHSTDVWVRGYAKRFVSEPVLGQEIVPEADLHRTEFYNDWLRHADIHHIVGGGFRVEGRTTAYLGIHRSRRAGAFDVADKRTFELLLPHLEMGILVLWRLRAASHAQNMAFASLNALPTGVIIVGTDCTLLFANTAADHLLTVGQGIRIQQGRLHAVGHGQDTTLERLVRQAAQAPLGRSLRSGGLMTVSRGELRPLSLLVCPLHPETSGAEVPRPMALIFLGDPENRTPIPAAILIRLYGLTPAEARLAEALLTGHTLQDYADSARISLHTVKTQLKFVFAKTGTKRQSDLIRDLLSDPVLHMCDGRVPVP